MYDTSFIALMEVHIFALIILIIILFNITKHSNTYLLEQRLYSYLLYSNIFTLILDIIRLYVNGQEQSMLRFINIISSTMMMIFTPIVPMLWTLYIDYKIHMNKERMRKCLIYIVIPVIVNIIFVLISLIGGIDNKVIFHVDVNNLYHRGELYNIMVFSSYAYLVYSYISIIVNKDIIDEIEYRTLTLFTMPPFIGGILQSMIFGLKLTWISMTLSMFIIFIDIQNNLLYVDVLTGLYNRRNLEKYLKSIFNQKNKIKTIGGVLIDINDFKLINDNYGHNEGDRALKYVSKILRTGFNKNDFISRYAGDEFIIVCEVKNLTELQSRIDSLEKNINIFNETSKKPYKISISKGYDIFTNNSGVTEETFIKTIDSLMYKDKERYRKTT